MEVCPSFLWRSFVATNKAAYTAESVACDWAGAVMRKLPENAEKTNELLTNRPTNQPTNGPTQWGIESRARD